MITCVYNLIIELWKDAMTPSTLWGPETGRDSHGYPDMRIQIHADMRIHMDNADTVTEYRYNSRYL